MNDGTPAIYSYVLFSSGILAGLVTLIVLGRFRLYSRRVRIPFAVLSLSSALWATAYGFQLLSAGHFSQLLWGRIAWLGAAILPTCWLIFSLLYTGEKKLVSRRMVALLSVEPAVTFALTWTTQSHGLFMTEAMLRSGQFASLDSGAGPLFVAHTVYILGISGVGLIVLGSKVLNSDGVHRLQATVLLMVGSLPTASLMLELFEYHPAPISIVPLSLGVSAGLVIWALFRYRLFDITPIARDAILSEMRDAVVVIDEHNRVIEANGAAATVLEPEVAKCIGKPVLEITKAPREVREVLNGNTWTEAVIGDDTPRYFEVRSENVGEPTQEQAKLLVFTDVTERRQTEEEFRALIENSRDIITVLNEDGSRRYTSPSVKEVLGHQPEDLVGSSSFDIIHPEDRAQVRREFEYAIEHNKTVRTECRVKHKNGTWRQFETVGVNLFDDPAVDGLVLNSRDVTSRHQYEQRLRVLNRVLRHDLRNDMNVILGHADLLLNEDVPAASKSHAHTIKRKATSLVNLGERTRHIDTTLDRSAALLEPVEAVECLEAELRTLESEHPNVRVNRELPEEKWVYADELLKLAVKNLFDNAIEHTDRVIPELTVSFETASELDDAVEIRIADNGPGIPAAELSVLKAGFETPLEHISGLGLWLAKWIVEQSNGGLRFEDNQPRGTVAVVRLQAANQPRSSAESVESESRAE
ncbi:histidine kinase N-terminal 7TM domain-containing protein [Haloferax sp. DFSO60]|uniref:histidine kinase N-terminal 7TM domain-containing protein n=1 Tax=Haloferax sp. DFSO60 TaxID=3388652 RepID=UPI00397D125B